MQSPRHEKTIIKMKIPDYLLARDERRKWKMKLRRIASWTTIVKENSLITPAVKEDELAIFGTILGTFSTLAQESLKLIIILDCLHCSLHGL